MNRFLSKLRLRDNTEEPIDIERAASLSWSQVQQLMRTTFQRRGYTVAAMGGQQAPVDMVLQKGAERVFLECRHWGVWEVPEKAVHELAGYASGAGADHAIMITAGHFSDAAREYAKQRGVELVDGRTLPKLVAS